MITGLKGEGCLGNLQIMTTNDRRSLTADDMEIRNSGSEPELRFHFAVTEGYTLSVRESSECEAGVKVNLAVGAAVAAALTEPAKAAAG